MSESVTRVIRSETNLVRTMANVFEFVARGTGYENTDVPEEARPLLNISGFAGPLSTCQTIFLRPFPDTLLRRRVVHSILCAG